MRDVTKISNYVVKLQLPNLSWRDLESFAFLDDAELFASGITVGASKVFSRTTTTIIEEEEIQ